MSPKPNLIVRTMLKSSENTVDSMEPKTQKAQLTYTQLFAGTHPKTAYVDHVEGALTYADTARCVGRDGV